MAQIKERDRELSEEKLINAIGESIEEVGFEKLGINQIAQKAGYSKNLIYRYFGSLDGLIYAYMKKHDFWTNTAAEKPETSDIKKYLKKLYRRQIAYFRTSTAYKRLRRWELSADKDIINEIRVQREKNGMLFIDIMSHYAKIDKKQICAITALVDAGITYLAMFEDRYHVYNGINIRSDKGWEQIAKGIDTLIDIFVNE